MSSNELRSAASSASRSPSSLRATLRAQPVEHAFRGLDADVGGDQPRLELVEHRVVDAAAGQQVREVVGQPRVAAIELLAQPLEQARLPACGRRRLSSVLDLKPNIASAGSHWLVNEERQILSAASRA